MSGGINPYGSSDQRGRDITDLKRRLAKLQAEVDALTAGAATTASDVSFSPVGGISATNVQAALAEVDSEKAPVSHTHLKSQITDFAHTHPQSDITNLVSDLAGKAASSHTHAISDLPVATSGTSSSTQLVRADDSRLSNARTPTAHSHAIADLPVATSGTSSSTQLVRADDSRLSNARAPTSHSHAIADLPVATSGTSSSTQLVRADDSRLSNARTPTAHTHSVSDITGLGALATKSTVTNSDIGGDAVDNGQLANMPALTIKMNDTGATDSPKDVAIPAFKAVVTYSLDELSDVDLTGAADGHVLKRVGGVWVPATDNTGSAGYATGTFTMATGAATTTLKTDSNITSTSKILFIPTNANAFSMDGAVTSYTVTTGSMAVTHQASSLSRTFAYLVIP